MHTPSNAIESLEMIWDNFLTVCRCVDLDTFSPKQLDEHAQSPIRPFRIATFLARQGVFIATWNLWEYYSRSLCKGLPNQETKASHESTVDWVGRSLDSNGKSFSQRVWFADANSLRNLIAHNGARVNERKSEQMHGRAVKAFSDLEILPDGYLLIEHEHVAELAHQVEMFVRETE